MKSVRSERRKAPRAEDPELRGRRAEGRACLLLPASAEALSGHLRVNLLDVSRAGARLQGSRLPAVGKDVILRCAGIDTFGSVAWVSDDECGMHFDEPITLEELVRLRALSAAASRSPLSHDEQEGAADWMNGLAR